MNRRLSSFILIILALALLGLAVRIGAHARVQGDDESAPALGADAPAGVRFVTVALGGFRGILADCLWLRATELQDEGRFFEVAQLADWITRLQPRYPEVWAYHAWNMAYNITAVIADPADRWHWVRNGVRLLRDEGIPSNPRDPKLYWELGWLFFDKVGGRWDEATLFYRLGWARELSEAMGGVGDDAARRLASIGLDSARMKAIDQEYGPLEWRLPESHALYWGYSGLPYQHTDSRWCERLVWMGMTATVESGALAFSPAQRIYVQGPRLDVAAKGVRLCYERAATAEPLVRLVMVKFLNEATLHFYAFGSSPEAEAALSVLKRLPDYQEGDMAVKDYVHREILARVKGQDAAGRRELVVRHLTRSDLWRRLTVAPYAAGYERLGHLFHDAWVQEDKTAPAWEALAGEAGARSLRDMPEVPKTQPQSP
jgi:hypothetical protein